MITATLNLLEAQQNEKPRGSRLIHARGRPKAKGNLITEIPVKLAVLGEVSQHTQRLCEDRWRFEVRLERAVVIDQHASTGRKEKCMRKQVSDAMQCNTRRSHGQNHVTTMITTTTPSTAVVMRE